MQQGHEVFGLDVNAASINQKGYTHYICDISNTETLPDISDVEILVGLRDTYDNFNKLGIVANHKRQAIIEKCLRLPIIADDSDLEKFISE